jgi:predicted metal-dependent phosphoesterase TrpH
MKPIKILKIAKKRKLNGIAITDHNTIKGGLEAKRLNKDKNFEVIVAAEIKTKVGEIIGYYLKKEIKTRDPKKVINEIKKQGGIAVMAHPFGHGIIRKCAGIDIKYLRGLQGVETHNARNMFHWENFYAELAAAKYKLAKTGGSDAHFYTEIGRGYTLFNGSLKSAIKKKKTRADGKIAPLPIQRGISMFRKIGVKFIKKLSYR